MTYPVSDIWFRTAATLERVADAIGLVDTTHDAENHWEWVIGTSGGLQLDVTRTHTTDAINTDTRIFRLDNQPFIDADIDTLCKKLLAISESDICVGQWQYLAGNEFDKIVFSRFDNDPKSGEQ